MQVNAPPEDYEECAALLAKQIASLEIAKSFATFEWARVGLPKAWEVREHLEMLGRSALIEPLSYAGAVYKWGFGNNPIKRTVLENPSFAPALDGVFRAWSPRSREDISNDAKLHSLTNLLLIPAVGIATASKWICFLNQKEYAIYDSRVSLGLRNVGLNGKRPFPIVGRRSLKASKAWRPDLSKPQSQMMASAYMLYLHSLNKAAKILSGDDAVAAHVEMALFMLGNVWPPETERLPFGRSGSSASDKMI